MAKSSNRIKIDGPLPDVMSAEEFRARLCNPVKGAPNPQAFAPPPKPNKYKAKVDHVEDPETGELVRFHSRREANYFRALLRCKELVDPENRVAKIERQVRFDINVQGRFIGWYALDFRITYESGRVKLVDTKGYRNPKSSAFQLFRVKKELVEALYGVNIELD